MLLPRLLLRFLLHVSPVLLLAVTPAGATSGTSGEASAAATFRRGVNVAHYTAIIPGGREFGDPRQFSAPDVAWIAAQGFDHLRLPVDGTLLLDAEGHLAPARLEPVNRVLEWAGQHGLGVILDIHRFEGADCADQVHGADIYERPDLIARFARLWADLAATYRDIGPRLRFELLNEPIARDHAQVNQLHATLIAAIRAVDRERVLILNTNRWADLDHLPDLALPADDPHLVASIHFYRPFQFTHQGTSWSELGQFNITGIPFPGVMPDLKGRVPEGHWLGAIAGQRMDAAALRTDLARVAAWAREHRREVYAGEFGAYSAADAESRRAWYAAMGAALTAEGLAWAVWEYNHHFGVRDAATGEGTVALEALRPFLRP